MSESGGTRGTVIYIGHFALPDGNAAAHRVRGNARILRDLGFRVVLLGAARSEGRTGGLVRCDSGEAGIEGWHMAYPASARDWLARIVSAWPLAALMRAARISDPAMVICYNYPALAQARMAQMARKLGARAVADCTEWYARQRLDGLASLIKNIDTPLRMHLVNPRMDGLITTSPFITRFYGGVGLPIVELPTIQRRLVPLAPPRVRTGLAKRLFFAGSGLDPRTALSGREGLKDRLDWVLELLDAAQRKGAEFTLDVFGVSEEDYRLLVPAHGGLLARLGARVIFHGRVPHARLLAPLTAADFSIFLRRETRMTMAGFASKFSESVTYGTPVICTGSPSLVGRLEEGRNGYRIDCSDMAAAAARLAWILCRPPERVAAMKAHCAASQPFAHEAFAKPVSEWLGWLGLEASHRGAAVRHGPSQNPQFAKAPDSEPIRGAAARRLG